MRTEIRCRQCQIKLSVKIELQGRTIRCPKCTNPVKVTLAPVVLPQLGNKPGSTPLMAIPVEEEPMWAVPLTGNADFEVLPDEEPVAPVSLPKPKSKPARLPTPAPVEEETDSSERRPSKKKKKKNKYAAKQATSIPVWMWIAGGVGALITTGGLIFGIILLMRVGTPDGQDVPWGEYLLIYCINVPISLVVLIISMFLSSALGGGINFGDAKTAIIGSIFLIAIVNVVNLIPVVGRYLTLIVWLVGFMTIFGLDPWEARFLLFINWLLNYAIGMAVMHFMIAHMNRDNEINDDPDDVPVKRKPAERNRNRNNKRPPKDDPDDDDKMGYYQPEGWHQRMGDWVESHRRVAV